LTVWTALTEGLPTPGGG